MKGRSTTLGETAATGEAVVAGLAAGGVVAAATSKGVVTSGFAGLAGEATGTAAGEEAVGLGAKSGEAGRVTAEVIVVAGQCPGDSNADAVAG